MSKKVCIFNAENYFQDQIISNLNKSDSDFELYVTYNKSENNKNKKKESIRKILKKSKQKLLRNYLFHSDIIIVDLLANETAEEDVNFICQTFSKKKQPETPTKIILISSLLTWKETETNKLKKLFKKFNITDFSEWEENEAEMSQIQEDQEEENKTQEEENQMNEHISQNLQTPKGINFNKEQLGVQTEKKQEPKGLKGVKSEMAMTQIKDLEQKLTQNGVGFKSNQINNNDLGRKFILIIGRKRKKF